MEQGAFVLVDCLGFRGIWNRIDPRDLVAKLRLLEDAATKRIVPAYGATKLSFGPVKFHLRLLSDTVALSVQYEPRPDKAATEYQKNLLVSMACASASELAAVFMSDDKVPLPLRGCISFGEHLCEGNFLIGPAVDEAADYMNEPEGARRLYLGSTISGEPTETVSCAIPRNDPNAVCREFDWSSQVCRSTRTGASN
jgi:hypothetical protein